LGKIARAGDFLVTFIDDGAVAPPHITQEKQK